MEANPGDLTLDTLNALRAVGINRLSIGIQSFQNDLLRLIGRRHNAQQAQQAVRDAQQAGFGNISIDLMYGFPNETIQNWEDDINKALALNVEHLSAYCLMIEENTPLYEELKAKSGKWKMDEELERAMYELLITKLTAAGYEHYEISNFAKPGFRSRHNSSYWDGTPYIGIGAAAHSYDINSRSWNIADIHQYIKGMEEGQRIFEQELIDEHTRYNDAITVALRTKDGLNLNTLSESHKHYCLENAQKFINDELLTYDDHRLRLTRKGLFVSDMIMSELIWVD
jgi:oxygen-independent coproporphyrinogen-3 oxidase